MVSYVHHREPEELVETDRDLLRGNTPTLILAILRDGPQHGYAIAQEIERLSASVLQLNQGTLYPALHALERDGLIEGRWHLGAGERSKRVYSITPLGVAELDRRTQAWGQFAGAVDRVILGNLNEQPA
jgi:PadR family transcriptional regulator, regulatory protein PadR